MKQSLSFARRLTALVLAAVMLCVAVPAAFAEDAAPGATTIGGANTTLIPEEEENCLSWLFGSKDKITLPYPVSYTHLYAIGMNKSNTALLEAVNAALEELKADGTLQAIVDKYIKAE